MHALGGLVMNNGDVDAPGHPGVRDYMLRYMAEVFVGGSLGATAGLIMGWMVSIVFGFLLLSAVNTALVDIISVTFLMSRDGEMPPRFSKLNAFGVPTLGMILAAAIPLGLVLLVKDMVGLADLYAVGVVGAIATNLGASATDKKLPLTKWERGLMYFTFAIMLAIEISLFVDKPNARVFAVTVLAVGLILRGLASERTQRRRRKEARADSPPAAGVAETQTAGPIQFALDAESHAGEPMLAAIRGMGRTLDFAIEEAKKTDRPLYLLFVREQPVVAEDDRKRKWTEDEEAREIFTYALAKAEGHRILPAYAVSDATAETIVDFAATVGASYLIVGAPARNMIVNLLRGNIVRNISDILPEEIHLLVYA